MWTTPAPTTPSCTRSAWPSATTSADLQAAAAPASTPTSARASARTSRTPAGRDHKTNTQVGGKIFLGAELNSGPFIEAAYEILPQSTHINGSSYRFDGFDVAVGYRF